MAEITGGWPASVISIVNTDHRVKWSGDGRQWSILSVATVAATVRSSAFAGAFGPWVAVSLDDRRHTSSHRLWSWVCSRPVTWEHAGQLLCWKSACCVGLSIGSHDPPPTPAVPGCCRSRRRRLDDAFYVLGTMPLARGGAELLNEYGERFGCGAWSFGRCWASNSNGVCSRHPRAETTTHSSCSSACERDVRAGTPAPMNEGAYAQPFPLENRAAVSWEPGARVTRLHRLTARQGIAPSSPRGGELPECRLGKARWVNVLFGVRKQLALAECAYGQLRPSNPSGGRFSGNDSQSLC